MPRKTLTLAKPPVYVGPLSEVNDPEPYPKKIAIVGCYPASWENAPFSDESWEIWGFSRRNMGKLPRCDKWFELHSENKFQGYERDVPGYGAWLKRPNTVLQKDFPKDELIARFGEFFFDEGQASWMLAYAMILKPAEIGIWGVECVDKYARQRYAIQHFISIAEYELGIPVTVPGNCLLKEKRPLYGFPPALAK